MFKVDPDTFFIAITRGDSGSLTFGAVDDDENPYIPSDGDSLTFSVSQSASKPALFSVTNIMNDNVEAFWDIMILPEHTQGFKFGDYVYDVELKHGGLVTTIIGETDDIHPKFRVWKEVTLP